MKITKELFDQWLDELRSRRYSKIQGRLRRSVCDNNKNTLPKCCAQGVLANLINPDGWVERDGFFGWREKPSSIGVTTDLNPLIDPSDNLSYRILKEAVSLNDRTHRSLPEIADRLESMFAKELT